MSKFNYGFKGSFKLTKIDAASGEVTHDGEWQDNLLTNGGMDYIAVGAIGSYCRIGTGTTAPSFSDTTLVSQSASTSSVIASASVNNGAPNYETIATQTYQFPQGAVVGNMAELGVGWSATGATLATRALILDSGGSPTTITVLAGEILQVTYRMTVYPPLVDSTGTVVIGSDTYNFIARPTTIASVLGGAASLTGGGFSYLTAYAYTGAIAANTGSPTGGLGGLSSGSFSTYVPGNYYRDCTVSAAINAANGNIATIVVQAIGTGYFCGTQIGFTPAIPKLNTETFSLTVRVSWSRHS